MACADGTPDRSADRIHRYDCARVHADGAATRSGGRLCRVNRNLSDRNAGLVTFDRINTDASAGGLVAANDSEW